MTEKEIENSIHAKKSVELFQEGYSCAQAVFLAFEDTYDLDRRTALRLSSSFGAGMGRLREVCGAVSGMFLTAGLLYGPDVPGCHTWKAEHYARIQFLAEEFKRENGSIICRELLGLSKGKDSPIPEKRTESYYKKRPCVRLIAMASYIMENYIDSREFSGGDGEEKEQMNVGTGKGR